MLTDADRLSALFKAYVDNKISDEEREELENWLSQSPGNRNLFNNITRGDHLEQELTVFNSFDPSAAFDRYNKKQAAAQPLRPVSFYPRSLFVFAAAALVAGIIFLVWPAVFSSSDKAMGKLASGFSNTISTPKGKTYQLLLPDGSRVWLNAASSIKYPPHFGSRQRVVAVTGEAYFEVARDANRPFSVIAGSMSIEVLGTSFNVMAYPEESNMITTLVDGKVKVLHGGAAVLLTPNQEAQISSTAATPGISVKLVNVQQAVAWKKNDFNFDNTDLNVVLRQVSRWYNAELIYIGTEPAGNFSGMISREKKLPQVLNLLRQSGLMVTRKGEKIFIK